jgi:hypothetical protein
LEQISAVKQSRKRLVIWTEGLQSGGGYSVKVKKFKNMGRMVSAGFLACLARGNPLGIGFEGLRHACWLLILFGFSAMVMGAGASTKKAGWAETMVACRASCLAGGQSSGWLRVELEYPVQWDWWRQDAGAKAVKWFENGNALELAERINQKVWAEIGGAAIPFQDRWKQLKSDNSDRQMRGWLELYEKACEARRLQRLKTVMARAPRIVFVRRHTARPPVFSYTEGQSDTQGRRRFQGGSELCLLELEGGYGKVRTLVSDTNGVLTDPAISWDGERVAFAWKQSQDEDDYHLHEYTVASNDVRQVTAGLGFSDYSPTYLPNGDLLFVSSRCVQADDCGAAEVGHLYTCDTQGRYLRRLSFDQGDVVSPAVAEDGWVVYTRCDHNGRGQAFSNGLFQMYPDGTGQTELYGNQSWFPSAVFHARSVPGSGRFLAVLGGYSGAQAGKLAVIDPASGREGTSGIEWVAPRRSGVAVGGEDYGQTGELWRHPYPLGGDECLVSYAPQGWNRSGPRAGQADFGIYWMDFAGRRELLVDGGGLPCDQPVVLGAKPLPVKWANRVDYNQSGGTYYIQDIYAGKGLAGVARGTVRRLRVVALEYRAAAVRASVSEGRAGRAAVGTPVSIGNGSWEVKKVLGEAKVYEDGSALFAVPARQPVYFQALDAKGRVVQTMRSWSTLQPGEYFSCVGCHESQNQAPPTEQYGNSLAMQAGRQELTPPPGPVAGFSFPGRVQPILNRHCIRCHSDRRPVLEMARGQGEAPLLRSGKRPSVQTGDSRDTAFSLLGNEGVGDVAAGRGWSDAYLVLTQATRGDGRSEEREFRGNSGGRLVNWIEAQSAPEAQPPGIAGSLASGLLPLLESGHAGIKLSPEELEVIACWIDLGVPYCGSYQEANLWNAGEQRLYRRAMQKRKLMEDFEQDNIADLVGSKDPARGPGPARPMISGPPR